MKFVIARTLSLLAIFAFASAHAIADDATSTIDTGFMELFDGTSLDGWKKAEQNTDSWQVEDGKLVCHGDICHLFYVGNESPWKNFHFSAEVMTTPGSNAGIYFHTKYQAEGWPKQGFECQMCHTKIPRRPAASTASTMSLIQV